MDANIFSMNSTDSSERKLPCAFSKFELDIKRIEKLAEETLDKLTFAMTIPQLADNNYEHLEKDLTKEQLEMIKQVFKEYIPAIWIAKQTNNQTELSNFQSIWQVEEYFNSYSMRTKNIPQKDENNFSNVFLILYGNKNIRELSEMYKHSISEGAFNFIEDINIFFNSIIAQMKVTPEEAKSKEAYLRRLYLHYQELKDDVHILEKKTTEQIANNKEMLKDKLNEVLLMKEKINTIFKDCEAFVKKSGSDADQQMLFDWKSSEHEQEALQEKVNKEMIDLEYLRNKYVEEEKGLRVKRLKAEKQLILFLETYDRDMQSKQNQVDVQEQTMAKEKKVLIELQEKYDEQDTAYKLLMEEKSDYESRIRKAKLHEIKCSLAARKIQRFYKNYRQLINLSGKKDLLKSKKKRRK